MLVGKGRGHEMQTIVVEDNGSNKEGLGINYVRSIIDYSL